jgi:hypothetical protein
MMCVQVLFFPKPVDKLSMSLCRQLKILTLPKTPERASDVYACPVLLNRNMLRDDVVAESLFYSKKPPTQ